MTEREVLRSRVERETYKFVAISFKCPALELGAKNLCDPNEIVLFTRALGLSADLTIVADNRSDHTFVAILAGHYLPSPNKIYGEGYALFQLYGGNLSRDLMRKNCLRLPPYGKAIVWDENVSLEKAIDALREINERKDELRGQTLAYFFPAKYVVREEFMNGDSMFLLPRRTSANEALKMFNRPELLAPFCHPGSGKVVGFILDCQKEYFVRKEAATNQVLIDWGISPELMAKIPKGKASRILDKVQNEIARRMGQSAIITKL